MSSYELLRTLDRGGMAEVFLARLVGIEGFEKRVVLKRVLPHLARDERFIGRFFDEARVAAQLAHPNIVQIFELGEERGQYFIAMEYVEGKNLRDVCKALSAKGQRLPTEHALRVTSLILDGLSHAHTRRSVDGRPLGIVHRDVSPSNVLLSWDGGLKLIDFGIAKTLDAVERTRPGSVIGKMGYMSPEQCRGEPVDARSDVYATGVVLYRMLFDQLPFPGKTEIEVGESIVKGIIVAPELRDPEVPEPLADLLHKALEAKADDRFASARAFQTAVDKCLAELGLFASSGTLAEFLEELFGEERAFAAVPDRGAETTKSRVVTLIASVPTASNDEHPHVTLTGAAPSPEAPSDDEEDEEDEEREAPAAPPARPERTVTATVRMSPDELAALEGGDRAAEPTVKRPDLSGLSSTAGPQRSRLPRVIAGVLAGLLVVGGVGAAVFASDPSDTREDDENDENDEGDVAEPGSAADASAAATAGEVNDGETRPGAADVQVDDDEPASEERDRPTSTKESGRTRAEAVTRDRASTEERPTRRRRRRSASRQRVPTGTLEVVSLPWAQVYIDGKRKGITPIARLKVPEGTHQLLLVNPDQKLKKKLSVKIEAGAHRRVAVRLAD